MYRSWLLLAVTLTTSLLTIAQPNESHRPTPPHVILISLDTTRADYLGCYGNTWVRTPNIDTFAAESILFENCLSTAPTTLASHTSMMTGKYPHTHGIPRNGFFLSDDNETLAEVLHGAGYHTAGFPAAFPLNGRFNFDQGFDFYADELRNGAPGRPSPAYEIDARRVSERVLEYLDAHEGEQPLFLFVHFFDPHAPYRPPAPYDRMYGRIVRRQARSDPAFKARIFESRREKQTERIEHYAGEISYMDEHLGALFDGLCERGIYDNAVILLTSDHGESLLDSKPYFNHGYYVYQSTMHLAFLLRLPKGARAGEHVYPVVSNIDYMPTLLGYLGLPIPRGVEGSAIALGQEVIAPPERVLYGEATKPYEVEAIQEGWPNVMKSRVARDHQFTYIYTPYDYSEAFYDLSIDPRQEQNRLPEMGDEASVIRLRQLLEAWSQSADPLPSYNLRTISPEVHERLEALGYLE